MKRITALRYSQEIACRIKKVNGILATPLCQYEAIKIQQVWIFGSTAKGSLHPNDLDVLIKYKLCGRRRTWRQTTTVKPWQRIMGLKTPPCSFRYMCKWLTKNMIKVSRHDFDVDNCFADGKIEIYPRFKLK